MEGFVSTERATEILQHENEGTFLLHFSSDKSALLTISYRTANRVLHSMISNVEQPPKTYYFQDNNLTASRRTYMYSSVIDMLLDLEGLELLFITEVDSENKVVSKYLPTEELKVLLSENMSKEEKEGKKRKKKEGYQMLNTREAKDLHHRIKELEQEVELLLKVNEELSATRWIIPDCI